MSPRALTVKRFQGGRPARGPPRRPRYGEDGDRPRGGRFSQANSRQQHDRDDNRDNNRSYNRDNNREYNRDNNRSYNRDNNREYNRDNNRDSNRDHNQASNRDSNRGNFLNNSRNPSLHFQYPEGGDASNPSASYQKWRMDRAPEYEKARMRHTSRSSRPNYLGDRPSATLTDFKPTQGGVFHGLSIVSEKPQLDHVAAISQRPLLVLDLNGTLLHRTKVRTFVTRPHLGEFMSKVFQHYAVMVWSSARPENVKVMVDAVFDAYKRQMLFESQMDDRVKPVSGKSQDHFVAVWDRRSFGFTPREYHGNPITVKDLDKIWAWKPCWSLSNTVIIDDSEEKVSQHRDNWVELSSFENTEEQLLKDEELKRLGDYLVQLASTPDVRAVLRHQPFATKHIAPVQGLEADDDGER